ncbi:galactosylceramide sulfotransferase-like [Asterias amurensis]|uniref:galactosylceramide sulfotransferase-like n=1 Tax=Asterias amurensis TaxID=7602 RepID=UPI003AB649B5
MSDSKLQGFSWRKVLSVGLGIASFVMFSYVYYGFTDLKTHADRYHIASSSIIRSASGHRAKIEEYMNIHTGEAKNQSSYLDLFTLKEKVPKDDLFDINVNASKSTASLRDSSSVVDNNRHTAKFSPLVDFTKPTTRNPHAGSVTFQGSTRRQSAQGPTTLSKGSSTRDCTPRKNIVFFKMHKCSSSTVQNILLRYGEEHSLDFVLPPAGNYLGHSHFSRKWMIEFPVKEYNILCHHTMFDETAMKAVMPANAVYVSILRDPVTMFESTFTYQHMASMYHLPSSHGLELFLERPEQYYKMGDGGLLHARSPMIYNFGLPKADLGDVRKIEAKIEELEMQFDLVMMTEHFEESLILFRHLMCWEIDDIVFFKLNARSKSSVKTVSASVADKIKKWNYGDVKLYETFNKTFWRKVREFGEDRMREEVAQLKMRKDFFSKHCISQVVNNDNKVWHPAGIGIDSFKLRPEAMNDKMCVRMARTELPYTDLVRNIQKKRYYMH